MTRRLITSEGEEALRRLNALSAFYSSSAVSQETEGPPRLNSVTSVSTDQRTLQETVIVRCVTVVEAYMTDLGKRLVNDRLEGVPADDTALVSLAGHLRDSRLVGLDQGKWDGLVTLWSEGLGVPVRESYPGYSSLVALRTTRHAIAHRYGEITQLYRKQHLQRLVKEGFRDPLAAEGPVPLSDYDVRDALSLTVGAIRWFEQALVAA